MGRRERKDGRKEWKDGESEEGWEEYVKKEWDTCIHYQQM